MDMASFRNLIVHSYGTIDQTIVQGIFQKRLGDFEDCAAAVMKYRQGWWGLPGPGVRFDPNSETAGQ
jgi:hypothetical protein